MRALVAVSCVFLAGCASLSGVDPDIDYHVMVAAVVKECDQPAGQYTDPSTAMEVGFTKVIAACQAFFDDATRAQQNAQETNKGLDLLLVAATAVINPTVGAVAAVKAITITTAGIVLAKALIDDYSTIRTFGNYLYKVQKLTTASMEDYMSKARSSPPKNYCLAYTYVQKLAMLCSLSALKSTLDEQVALPSGVTPSPANGPPAPAPLQGRMFQLRDGRSSGGTGSGGPPSISYSVIPR